MPVLNLNSSENNSCNFHATSNSERILQRAINDAVDSTLNNNVRYKFLHEEYVERIQPFIYMLIARQLGNYFREFFENVCRNPKNGINLGNSESFIKDCLNYISNNKGIYFKFEATPKVIDLNIDDIIKWSKNISRPSGDPWDEKEKEESKKIKVSIMIRGACEIPYLPTEQAITEELKRQISRITTTILLDEHLDKTKISMNSVVRLEIFFVFFQKYMERFVLGYQNLDALEFIEYYKEIYGIHRKGVNSFLTCLDDDTKSKFMSLTRNTWSDIFFKSIENPMSLAFREVMTLYPEKLETCIRKDESSFIGLELLHSYKTYIKSYHHPRHILLVENLWEPTAYDYYEFLQYHYNALPSIPRNWSTIKWVEEAIMGEYEMPQKQGNTKMDYLQSLLYEMTLKDNKEAEAKDSKYMTVSLRWKTNNEANNETKPFNKLDEKSPFSSKNSIYCQTWRQRKKQRIQQLDNEYRNLLQRNLELNEELGKIEEEIHSIQAQLENNDITKNVSKNL